MTDFTTPFLLCVRVEDIAGVIQKFDDWNRAHHGTRYRRPFYLEEKPPAVIDISPDTEQQLVDEINKEMSRPPSRRDND